MLDKVLPTQPISNFRKFGNEILEATEQGPVLVTQHGVGTGVLMSIELYNNIVSYIRSFYEAELLKRRLEDMSGDDGNFISFEEFSQRLQSRGLIDAK